MQHDLGEATADGRLLHRAAGVVGIGGNDNAAAYGAEMEVPQQVALGQ
jgi:hypothetical protein